MTEWAQNEVQIACKKEYPEWDGESFDYGCACYQSALKAYQSLCEDGHSGFSFSLTANILNRLMNHKPLTSIEDVPEEWTHTRIDGAYVKEPLEEPKEFNKKEYTSKRLSSLHKTVTNDGDVTFTDTDRVICYDVENETSSGWYIKLAVDVVDEMFPIKFPYYPPVRPYRVSSKEILTDVSHGDFNAIAFFDVITPDAETYVIRRFFKSVATGWEEITRDEWDELCKIQVKK